jgi:hypothetical protein
VTAVSSGWNASSVRVLCGRRAYMHKILKKIADRFCQYQLLKALPPVICRIRVCRRAETSGCGLKIVNTYKQLRGRARQMMLWMRQLRAYEETRTQSIILA